MLPVFWGRDATLKKWIIHFPCTLLEYHYHIVGVSHIFLPTLSSQTNLFRNSLSRSTCKHAQAIPTSSIFLEILPFMNINSLIYFVFLSLQTEDSFCTSQVVHQKEEEGVSLRSNMYCWFYVLCLGERILFYKLISLPPLIKEKSETGQSFDKFCVLRRIKSKILASTANLTIFSIKEKLPFKMTVSITALKVHFLQLLLLFPI